MAAGVPVIATAIGTNFRIIEDGVSGFLVNSEDEWVARIKELITDENLRQQIGTKGAEVLENRFSVNANKDIYLSIIMGKPLVEEHVRKMQTM